jgi:hypothetical protein
MQGDHQDLDILFLSYDESNADFNWRLLKERFPRAKRIHGIKGIREAHQKAAELSHTHFFYIVDGDNRVLPDFSFDDRANELNDSALYVFRCKNPVNGLVYGYGAIKIYNKSLLGVEKAQGYVDLATQVAPEYKVVPVIASETHFNSSAEEAWRGAFRECAKLASGLIKNQKDAQTQERLAQWCETVGNVPFAQEVLRGAREGRSFGLEHSQELHRINDYFWLKSRFLFTETQPNLHTL